MAELKKRQLVVAVKPSARLRVGLDPSLAPAMESGDVQGLVNLLRSENIVMRPLLGRSEERTRAMMPPLRPTNSGVTIDLSTFYVIDAPDERLDGLVERFRQHEFVEYAYTEPQVDLPVMPVDAIPSLIEPPSITPNFSARQGYLNSAPNGIDAAFAWTLSGGGGAGIQIIDIEYAWQLTHEDLLGNMGGVIAGTPINDLRWRNHGTSVLGIMGGDDNSFGIMGICPDATIRTIAQNGSFPTNVAAAIATATSVLSAGDIILVEAQGYGPRFGFMPASPGSQLGMIAVQYWPEVHAAITFATVVKGIIVVQAAGNGAEDLDDPIYSAPPLGFPPLWAPFARGVMDNAAIIVGAGAPPPGTHGAGLTDPDRSRLGFSNFGSCVDAQGWGQEVTTTGGNNSSPGDLQGGLDENLWYTDKFAGTSSASPIVVGALACIQGALKAGGKPLLTPIAARNLLRNFGSLQQDAPGRPATQRIGNRPDLFLMLAGLV